MANALAAMIQPLDAAGAVRSGLQTGMALRDINSRNKLADVMRSADLGTMGGRFNALRAALDIDPAMAAGYADAFARMDDAARATERQRVDTAARTAGTIMQLPEQHRPAAYAQAAAAMPDVFNSPYSEAALRGVLNEARTVESIADDLSKGVDPKARFMTVGGALIDVGGDQPRIAYQAPREPRTPSDFERKMGAAGYRPGTPEYQQAARQALGLAAPNDHPAAGYRFSGSGMEAQSYNVLTSVADKVRSGIPVSPQERDAYALVYQDITRARRFTTPDGRMFEEPGADLSGFPPPTALRVGQEPTATSVSGSSPAGSVKLIAEKPPSDTERKMKYFADRADSANKIAMGLEERGYNPTNFKDNYAENIPGIGNYIRSEEGQQYNQAKLDFSNAVLRVESGADAPQAEVERMALVYFPRAGDSQDVIEQKRAAREIAIQGLRSASGISASAPTSAPASSVPPPPPGFELME